MKLIDFHTHVFSDKIAERAIAKLAQRAHTKPFADGTVNGLLAQMEAADADIAVALPVLTSPDQFESVNQFAMKLNADMVGAPRKILSFGGIHPACADLREKMKRLREMGFLGVKIHPDYQDTFIDDERYLEIVACAKELDLIVVTHAGVDDGYAGLPVRCTPDRVLRLLASVPHSKLVLAHLGGNRMTEAVLEQIAGKDLFLDTSFCVHDMDRSLFRAVLNKHGADRILFATDCPWRDIREEVRILRSYGLPWQTEEKLFYRNAAQLLGIKEGL